MLPLPNSPRLADQAEAAGNLAYGRLCRASSAMWQDMAKQIQRGGEVIVRFPNEFLTVLPGAPLAPWEQMRPVRNPNDPAGLQSLYASQARRYPAPMTGAEIAQHVGQEYSFMRSPLAKSVLGNGASDFNTPGTGAYRFMQILRASSPMDAGVADLLQGRTTNRPGTFLSNVLGPLYGDARIPLRTR